VRHPRGTEHPRASEVCSRLLVSEGAHGGPFPLEIVSKRNLFSISAYRSDTVKRHEKTAIERLLEEAERLGVPVKVRAGNPRSGVIILRPGVSSKAQPGSRD
jgi:hypothetical protein